MVVVGVLAFVVALLVSVVLHEGGHFLTARKFGMKATQFFVGFGPTLWSRRRGELEYGVKAIPAGGFVKIVGMTPLEPLDDPADEPRAFYNQPAPQRTVVLAAGSFMHFVLCILLVWLGLWVGGVVDEHRVQVGLVAPCITSDTAPATQQACAGKPASPAKAAGLANGDEILTIDGTPVRSAQALHDLLTNHGPSPVTIVYRHDGQTRTVTTTLQPITVGGKRQWRIGVTPTNPIVAIGPLDAASRTPGVVGSFITNTASALAHFPSRLSTIFSNHRDPNGAVGVVGVSRISGDLLGGKGIAQGQSFAERVGDFLLLVAGVNLFVGVFNLLPLMPLDGGHIAVLAFEQGRDRLRRLRGYRGPVQRVDLTKLLPATYAVVAVFATLSLVLAAADILNPLKLG